MEWQSSCGRASNVSFAQLLSTPQSAFSTDGTFDEDGIRSCWPQVAAQHRNDSGSLRGALAAQTHRRLICLLLTVPPIKKYNLLM